MWAARLWHVTTMRLPACRNRGYWPAVLRMDGLVGGWRNRRAFSRPGGWTAWQPFERSGMRAGPWALAGPAGRRGEDPLRSPEPCGSKTGRDCGLTGPFRAWFRMRAYCGVEEAAEASRFRRLCGPRTATGCRAFGLYSFASGSFDMGRAAACASPLVANRRGWPRLDTPRRLRHSSLTAAAHRRARVSQPR